MRPTALRSWPHWSASSPKATRRWSAHRFSALPQDSARALAIDPDRSSSRRSSTASRAAHQHRSQSAEPCSATSSCARCSKPLNSKASADHPPDLPQAGRDHPCSRVLQLPRATAEDAAGRAHCRARPRELLAGDHRRSGFARKPRSSTTANTSSSARRRAPPPLSPASNRCRAAADHPRRRGLLNPPKSKCSAKQRTREENGERKKGPKADQQPRCGHTDPSTI